MILARIFSNIYKKDGGIILIDSKKSKVYLWKSKKRKSSNSKTIKRKFKLETHSRSRVRISRSLHAG